MNKNIIKTQMKKYEREHYEDLLTKYKEKIIIYQRGVMRKQ